ncbi:MAG: STAS domain-containing protein [Verrucomicrobiota bacterium]
MSEYSIDVQEKQCRVALEGDLTASVAPKLQACLKRAVEDGVLEIQFDLSRTTMLDSSGIGLLIATHNTVRRREGKIVVGNVSPGIYQLLHSMRLVTRLNVSDPRPT